MTKSDQKLLVALLFIGLLILAISRLFFSPSLAKEGQVVIKVSGEVVKKISLQEDDPGERYVIEGKMGKAIVETKGRKVRMLEAPCPDQICVKQGWLESSRQTIVCIPNEIVIYFEEKNPPVDATTG